MALTTEEIKKKMEANSAAWHTADAETKKKLEAENQSLGKQIGGTYNEASGTWSDGAGNNLYGTSNSTGTSKTTVSSGSGGSSNKTYTPNGGYTIGSQKGQGIAQNMGIGETYTASDGSVWKKENDGTITVVHKGVTTNNAYKPTDYSILLKQQMDAGVPYQDVEKALAARLNKALTTEGLGQYAYDDVYDAAWNYILEGRGEANDENSQADMESWLEDYNQNNLRPSAPQSDPRINELLNQILNREDFSYDAMNDPLYQQYAAQYKREGDRAMRDTLAEAAASAGGMNTYAITAAQQAANYYNSQLGDKIPELYQLAYQMYLQDKESMVQDLGILQDMDATQYNRYRDTMTDWKDDRNFAYDMYRDAVDQGKWQTEFDYNAMIDNRNFGYDNFWNNREWDANQKQLELENKRYDTEFDLENKRYDAETAREEVWKYIEEGIMPSADLISSAGMDMATVQAYVAAKQAEKVGKGKTSGSSDSGADVNGGNLGWKDDDDGEGDGEIPLVGDGEIPLVGDGEIPLVGDDGDDGDDEVSFKDLDAFRNYLNSFGNYDENGKIQIRNAMSLNIGPISDEKVLKLVEEGKVTLSADGTVKWAGKWNEKNYNQKYPY